MKRFLIAHSDAYTRRALEAAVQELGYEVEFVADGLDVVDRTLDNQPDAVLLGINLPGVGGLHVARTLRTLRFNAPLPILFITDNASESTRVLQAALAGVKCLQAPFEMGRMREQLMRLVTPNGASGAEATTDSAEGLTITDPPTGLFSRTYILHRLAYEGMRATRYHHELAVMLIGIRNFEELTKRRGQRGADEICMDIASVIRRTVRMVDLVGRTAMSEFMVILPETDMEGARAAATRLCNVLDEAQFSIKGAPERVRTYAGVSCISSATLHDNLALYANAEAALQRARASATARVVTA